MGVPTCRFLADSEEAKQKTAFITPDVTGQFERMIFGLCNAPLEFSRLMTIVLGPLGRNVARWYLDDILVAAADWKEMVEKLRLVFEALRAAKLTLNLKKCYFGKKEVEFLGHHLSEGCLRPGTKVAAVRNYPKPEDVHEIRRFLDLLPISEDS